MSSQLRVDKIIPVDGVPTGGGGGIIQIVHSTATSQTSQSGNVTTFTDTGLSAAINSTKELIASSSLGTMLSRTAVTTSLL